MMEVHFRMERFRRCISWHKTYHMRKLLSSFARWSTSIRRTSDTKRAQRKCCSTRTARCDRVTRRATSSSSKCRPTRSLRRCPTSRCIWTSIWWSLAPEGVVPCKEWCSVVFRSDWWPVQRPTCWWRKEPTVRRASSLSPNSCWKDIRKSRRDNPTLNLDSLVVNRKEKRNLFVF